MKKNFKLFFSIIFITYNISASNPILADGGYPQSEKETKWEEVGSAAGGEGLVFRPGRVKNESTKASGYLVNKYLWQASIETLNFIPLASADSNGGVIITEWYSPAGKQNYRFKINIFIKDDIIHPDSLEVKIFEEILKNNRWQQSDSKSDLALMLEDKILRKARTLYINADRK
ncbi:DUF3576 domain-containing protein [Rickettsia endosymbiont of Halotydeus destructor]|uniref:DUF3576 domain-containing protein n=1 Tax=Rickettsia endosymbiont of Halotydeus destructor TaxID=2996754 RepID=UPI003BB09EDB